MSSIPNLNHDALRHAIGQRLGFRGRRADAAAKMDPTVTTALLAMERASRLRSAISDRHLALINLAMCASVTHLGEYFIRSHIRAALANGSTKEEICEVLQLVSVLSIHGFTPGIQLLIKALGGVDQVTASMDDDSLAAASKAEAYFSETRGFINRNWRDNALFSPEFVKKYVDFSMVPWRTDYLPAKIKRFIYIAIDLSPAHLNPDGAAIHLKKALDEEGATKDEILELLENIALMGFHANLVSLAILEEELASVSQGEAQRSAL